MGRIEEAKDVVDMLSLVEDPVERAEEVVSTANVKPQINFT